ncbi:uncharacterized protein LOC119071570 isoform X2 [Bradysia coprophila]|uniref:uncharacterized protein LOC119071570 isoform X2 n=1 Tax=Bradysia coprophila TaxID=38358 RepID=UPI00187DB795|nr:uncharacterized protein LOC119071570 isoform X2 [Bradysia coprophila]
MKFELQSTLSVVFLSIINMCVCLQDIAEKTFNSLNNEVQHTKRHQHNQNNHHHHPHPHRWGHENFLLIDYLADGEMERRISYNGVTAKETSIGNSSKSLSLWQLSNGMAFIQMIYSRDDELIDCEYVRERSFVKGFLNKFYDEVETARSRNFSSPQHYDIKQSMMSGDHGLPFDFQEADESDNDAFGMRNLEYKQLRQNADVPDDMLPLMNYKNLKLQCDERHRQMKRIVYDLNSDHEESRRNATDQLERKKRSLSDWLIAPNTKWCGRGQSAGRYNELGGASKADKCCRRHDHCRMNIQAMSTKWHLFNYRPFTISHCSCDMRFRTCLKMADSSDATMVGKLFFNIVQTKCFVLKPERICKKRSWWGKCEKKVVRKRAHLRDNRKF